MAENSKIEWTHHTANLWHGCVEVHEGCDNCYAKALNNRYHKEHPHWGNDVPRLEIKSVWKDLERYQRIAAENGEMHRVFVGSMMDIFEKPMPVVSKEGKSITWYIRSTANGPTCDMNTSHLRDKLFQRIEIDYYPNLIFLFLTKRPSNINKYIPESWKTNPPSNVMFGTSVVNEETANKLIPQLLEVNGKKFLSCEPLLGQVDLTICDYDASRGGRFCQHCAGHNHLCKGRLASIDWIICGGESGHGARPMHPDWARSLRDQCKAAGVPFLFKQWGEYTEGANMGAAKTLWNMVGENGIIYNDIIPTGMNCVLMSRAGKKEAGRLLDGVEHNEFPTI